MENYKILLKELDKMTETIKDCDPNYYIVDLLTPSDAESFLRLSLLLTYKMGSNQTKLEVIIPTIETEEVNIINVKKKINSCLKRKVSKVDVNFNLRIET